jgi:hypothetical protein
MSESNASIQYVQKTVRVTREGDQLRIDPQELNIEDWAWVEWEFKNLEAGEYGFISFAPPLPRFGPFYSLRSLTGNRFLGKGNKGAESDSSGGSYGYRALVLDPTKSEPTATGVGMIHNLATQENTAPEIHVAYSEVKNSQGEVIDRILTVTPNPVGLNWGDTATWFFENLPLNAFAGFQFTPASNISDINTPDMNPGLGPFVAFNASTGDQGATVRANAMGFAVNYPDPKIYPSFTYHIELRDWEGKLLASHDPAIDNLGPPPPPD